MDKPREDLVVALIKSCWLVESARANILRSWGGPYEADGDNASLRADLIAATLARRDSRTPDHVLAAHTAWMTSIAGATAESVALGPAIVHRLSAWTDVYATPYLAGDETKFRELGHAELRVPVQPTPVTREQVVWDQVGLESGPRFAILTDLHIGAKGTEDLVRRGVKDINTLGVEFVIVPGDLTDDGEPEQFERVRKILDGLDAPFHAVLGNHDAVRRTTLQAEGHALFTETFGHPPVDRVIDFQDIQIALMDTTDPVPSPFPDWDLARGGFREDTGGTNGGALRKGQAEALRKQLDADKPTLLIAHHEQQPFAAFPPVMFGVREADSAELMEALRERHLIAVVAGHTHRSALTQIADGVPQLEIPAAKDWPYAFTVCTRTTDGLRTDVRQISDKDFVWERAQHIPDMYLHYATGPLAALTQTFKV